jgi:4-amino-4-deoxy-L-arabinose transferase-like glycosyltransferase
MEQWSNGAIEQCQTAMKQKASLIILTAIILLAAFLRLYRISDYMTFLGDEGRDVMVALEILEGNLTLLGPRASAGDFYLGPIYYYMIAPFLWLFNYDPVGPAIMVALVGIATVFLVYYVGKRFFDKRTGLFAAALYAVPPLVITYSHSSWNPNVLPFFSLLTILAIYKAMEMGTKGKKYFILTGFLLGISLQLHYIALILGVVVFFYVLLGKLLLHKKILVISAVKNYLQIFAGFIIGFSPFLLFELRHGFPNTKTIISFITKDTLAEGYESGAGFISIVGDVFYRSFAHLVFNSLYVEKYFGDTYIFGVFAAAAVLISIAVIINLYFAKNKMAVLLLYLWFFLGIILFGFYKKPIFDYYFTFFFPLPFLMIGYSLSCMLNWKGKKVIGAALSMLLFLGIFGFNLYDNKFRYESNRQKKQVRTIAEFIISKTEEKPFNFALITPGNSDHAYRYYFDILGHEAIQIENPINDPERKSVAKQLMVVCEQIPCEVLGHPLFDVAGFGQAEIAGEWDVSVVKVYRLVPYESNDKVKD